VIFADAYHWTPDQVDRMPAQFVAELLAYRTAQGDHAVQEADLDSNARERRQKALITKRKIAIMKRRNGDGKHR
jgi:hypothetical protein